MKPLKTSLLALAASVALSAAGSANAATLTNWYLDADGAAGSDAAVLVYDYIDLNGKAYVNNTFTSATTFTFNEAGSFLSNLVDSSTSINPLKTEFTGTGTGDTTTAHVTFNSGTLKIFDGLNQIAQFSLLSGDGQLQSGTVLPNGTFSLIFVATSLDAGYFFDSSMNDLSNNVADGLTFGFATTNAIYPVNPTPGERATLATIYNDAFAPDIVQVNSNGTTELLIGNNGQFRLSVPEPGSLALIGLGLLGFAGTRRRKMVA